MVVKLHDLRLEARVQQARGRRDELGEDRHADAHVGRDYRPGRRGERAQLPVLRRVEPGRADDQPGSVLDGDARVGERRRRHGEVEDDRVATADRGKSGRDRHAERAATRHLARVAAKGRVPGRLGGARHP